MRPNYDITHTILKLSNSISRQLGEASVSFLSKPSPLLREENELLSIHATLQLDFCEIDMADLKKLINDRLSNRKTNLALHVFNAIKTYRNMRSFEPSSKNSFLSAHKMFMNGLMDKPGKLRLKNVIYGKGTVATHLAPPPHLVGFLMDELFTFQQKSNEITLIKSCLFFYELLAIEPFSNGNGRTSRFWFKALLRNEFPVFEFIPLEKYILKYSDDYTDSLAKSSRWGKPTSFLEFILAVLEEAIQDFHKQNEVIKTADQRLDYFKSEVKSKFSRKDYMLTFDNISTATASRDLKLGIEKGLWVKEGEKRKTVYSPKE